MTEAYADTFYWLAHFNPSDAYHAVVRRATVPDRLVLTDAVRVEVMDGFSKRPLRPTAVRFWEETSADPQVVVVPLTESMLGRAADLHARRPDKDWSLTDCVSFIVMADRGIRTALTGDHHF